MNFTQKTLAALFLTSGAAWMSGCGGGADSTSTADPVSEPTDDNTTDTNTESTTSVSGRITGFGSVIVNGVHFDADAAQIMHDGQPITEDDLKVGMVIRLSGAVDADGVNGVATEIEFDEELKGPVATIDLANGSLVVLGQTILIDEDTALDNLTLDTLAENDFVEVSGYFDADGALRATLIEREELAENDDQEIEIKGVVRSLDSTLSQFLIGTQAIDFGEAEFDSIPDNTLTDGMRVEVKASALTENGVLIAHEIEYEEHDDSDEREGSELELEGLVTGVTSESEFAVNGRTVIVTTDTEFEEGTAQDVTQNSKIKVEGELNADGALVAEKVELRRRGNLELEAMVDSINVDGNALTVFGVEVLTTATTRWEDDSEAEVRYFDLADLNPGDSVKVKGYQNAEGLFVATALERKDADEEQEIELTGPVFSITDGVLNVMGVQVILDPELDESDLSELQTLLAGLAAGDLIKVKGTLSASNQLSAVEVEAEGDDGRNEFGGERRDDNEERDDEDDHDDNEDTEDAHDADEEDEDEDAEDDETEA